MRYIITESQALNYIKRQLTPEVYFEYIKDACENLIGSTDDEDDFIYEVGTTAVEEFLYSGGFFEEGLSGELAQQYYETLFDDDNQDIMEYILNFFHEHNDSDSVDSFDDLEEN